MLFCKKIGMKNAALVLNAVLLVAVAITLLPVLLLEGHGSTCYIRTG